MPSIHPVDERFAVEVRGVSLWESLAPGTVTTLRELFSRHPVLVFRRQALTEDELVRFAAHFGQVEPHVRTDWSSRHSPEITLITNLRGSDGSMIGGLGAGELAWHTDQSYVARPATGCLLHAVELPPDNPETWWADLTLAYEGLSEVLRRQIEGRSAIYSYARRVSGYEAGNEPPEEIARRVPDVRHPIVNRHPVTGRRSLYLDPGTMTGVDGLESVAGLALLDALTDAATRPQGVYRHRWQPGDVVMWDNAVLLHRRESFAPGGNRLMKRAVIRLPPERHVCPGPG